MFNSFSFVVHVFNHLHMYSLLGCKYVFIADGKVKGGTSPAPVAPPRRAHLTLNQLVFHKVLGKGSFGKVHPTMTHLLYILKKTKRLATARIKCKCTTCSTYNYECVLQIKCKNDIFFFVFYYIVDYLELWIHFNIAVIFISVGATLPRI